MKRASNKTTISHLIVAFLVSFITIIFTVYLVANILLSNSVERNLTYSGTIPREIENDERIFVCIPEKFKNCETKAISKNPVLTGQATYYGDYYHGRLTANGEVFDEMGMTGASNDLPFNTLVKVMYQDKEVIIRITDRGGFTHSLDLSKGAFEKLAPLSKGVLFVNYQIL